MSSSFNISHITKNEETEFHGSWYRGDHANFIPSKAGLQEENAVERFILKGWQPKARFISRETPIAAFGSCFAAEISNYLAARRFNLLGRDLGLYAHIVRFGEGMVNTFAIRQQIEWGLGKRDFPDNLWFGPDKEIAAVDPVIRAQTKDIIDTAGVFIITLGLSEIWYDRMTGDAFWRAIPASLFDKEKHGFRLSSVEENFDNLQAIYRCIRQARPEASIILTLSPIPLMATFRPISCATANSVSKAVLRVAIDKFMTELSEQEQRVFYFPSYEIISEMLPDSRLQDNRHLKPEAIQFVMESFEKAFCCAMPTETALPASETLP